MAKRSETIKCNCPACGTGLFIDLDDLSILASGDFAKKPEKTPESETTPISNAKESEADSAGGSGGGSGEADNGAPDNESENSGSIELDEQKKQSTKTESENSLGDW